jgi:hypothetical protein
VSMAEVQGVHGVTEGAKPYRRTLPPRRMWRELASSMRPPEPKVGDRTPERGKCMSDRRGVAT